MGTDVLLEQGWSRLTVRGVAARAGVSPGLISHHFGGIGPFRRAVVAEVVIDMLRPALLTMTSQATWQAGLAAVLRPLAEEASDASAHEDLVAGYDDLTGYGSPGPSHRYVLADLVVASMQDAVVREVVQESLVLARERLTGWLEQVGVPEQHVHGAAVLLVAVLDGLFLHHRVDSTLALRCAADALVFDLSSRPP